MFGKQNKLFAGSRRRYHAMLEQKRSQFALVPDVERIFFQVLECVLGMSIFIIAPLPACVSVGTRLFSKRWGCRGRRSPVYCYEVMKLGLIKMRGDLDVMVFKPGT